VLQQLTINFDPDLIAAYPTCRELVQARVHQIGRQQKAIAADMDLSPSHLCRKLAQAPGDSARLTLDDFENYLSTNDDRKPLHYLNAKYGCTGLAGTLTDEEIAAEYERRNRVARMEAK
jgi:hypothetical protein